MGVFSEVMRQKVHRQARAISNTELKVYNTVQLATEIEAFKKQERSLMTKVEQQQYVESVMQEKLGELNEQLENSQELCRSQIRKLQESQEQLQEYVSDNFGEDDGELMEKVEKFQQNLDLYKEIVKDPRCYMEGVEAQAVEDGEEPVEEDADMRSAHLVAKAMCNRNMTPEEEDREQEKIEQIQRDEEDLCNEKQWTQLQTMGIVFFAIVLLMLTIRFVKKGSTGAEDMGVEEMEE